MRRRDPAKAVQVLDLVLEFFANGSRWIQGQLGDYQGNHCLVGALQRVRAEHRISGDGAGFYLASVSGPGLMGFNDQCQQFDELRAVILEARTRAEAELRNEPLPAQQLRPRRATHNAALLKCLLAVEQAFRGPPPDPADLAKQQAAEARKRALIAELEQERLARFAAGDFRPVYTLCPEPPRSYRVEKIFAPVVSSTEKQSNPKTLVETLNR